MPEKKTRALTFGCAVIASLLVSACSSQPANSKPQGLLGRPLRVGIVSWPGYAGGIVANGGFKPNAQSIFVRRYGVFVEFILLEDVEVRARAFSRGGAEGVDVIWSTVDFWAYELPGFLKAGVQARAVMQVDWSQGGDAIVAQRSIQTIEDLKDKRISLALFTPSHWLLESSLSASSLNEADQIRIEKSLIGKSASPDARNDFVAGKVDAAVVWEPDVTASLHQRSGAHILASTATSRNLIADVMVAQDDFLALHADAIQAFVRGWLDGADAANHDAAGAARLLMKNEPLYSDLGIKDTLDGLSKVRLADFKDNVRMFGLDGSAPVFDTLFQRAGNIWVKRGYIDSAVPPEMARDTGFLQKILPAAARK